MGDRKGRPMDSTHDEYICLAMEGGCDVITEKPLLGRRVTSSPASPIRASGLPIRTR